MKIIHIKIPRDVTTEPLTTSQYDELREFMDYLKSSGDYTVVASPFEVTCPDDESLLLTLEDIISSGVLSKDMIDKVKSMLQKAENTLLE